MESSIFIASFLTRNKKNPQLIREEGFLFESKDFTLLLPQTVRPVHRRPQC